MSNERITKFEMDEMQYGFLLYILPKKHKARLANAFIDVGNGKRQCYIPDSEFKEMILSAKKIIAEKPELMDIFRNGYETNERAKAREEARKRNNQHYQGQEKIRNNGIGREVSDSYVTGFDRDGLPYFTTDPSYTYEKQRAAKAWLEEQEIQAVGYALEY